MTQAEINHLKTTVFDLPSKDSVWAKAFRLYNNTHEQKLHMKCRNCYFKVLKYHTSGVQHTR